MLKKILFLTLVGIISSTTLYAQEDEDGEKKKENLVHGEIEDNQTFNLNVVRVFLPLWCASFSPYNNSIFDLKGGLFLDFDKFNIEADYTYMLADRLFPDWGYNDQYHSKSILLSKFKTQSTNYIRGNTTYYFSSKDLTVPYKLKLKSHGNVDYVTYVDAIMTQRFGLRLGYEKGVAFYGLNNVKLNGFNVIEPERGVEEFKYAHQSTMMEYTHLNIGFSISKTYNLRVNFKEYGRKNDSYMSVVNFDLIFALKNKLDNVYATYETKQGIYSQNYTNFSSTNVNFMSEYNINDYSKKLPFGARISYRWIPFNGTFSLGAEAGYNPGLLNQINLYGKFNIQFSLGNRVIKKFKK
jgi:hypothetical protein